MTLGQKLHILLEERHLTQKQLAIELNMAPSTIGGYMQDSSEPDFATLKLIASYFHVTTDYLLDFHHDTGKGSQVDELLRIFQSLTEDQKELYIEQGRAFLKINFRRETTLSKSTSTKGNEVG